MSKLKPPSMHPEDMYEGKEMFAIFIRRKDGSEFISHGQPSGPALFFQRFRARDCQRKLKEHKLSGVVRRVSVTVRPLK